MIITSNTSLPLPTTQTEKTGIPGDRLKPGEVKGSASGSSSVRDTTKTGIPGDRLKPGEVKAGVSAESMLSSSVLDQLLALQQPSANAPTATPLGSSSPTDAANNLVAILQAQLAAA